MRLAKVLKYLVMFIWVTVFSTILICSCQETYYIFLLVYQYPCLAHFSFMIFLEKEAFSGFLIQRIKLSFTCLVRYNKLNECAAGIVCNRLFYPF